MNLLHYLVRLVTENYPAARRFVEELKGLEEVAKSEAAILENQVNAVVNPVKKIASDVCPSFASPLYLVVLGTVVAFCSRAVPLLTFGAFYC